ncbi:hypothetical protein B7R22_06590 [Subtercola boreus]|uniref:Fido domain-containing protein n=1 Tax=Subtercola boreus TaxID=120213 RepID=A0A3E0W1W7_9MICO|nr:Fic family protein [Subtercola boreus]RFA15493.1 hypothetical protein B7R22_06590 [Subtercola boreus]
MLITEAAENGWRARSVQRLICDIYGETEASAITLVLAELHSPFERIYLFIDGNGRTGRLVLNLALVRLGFPPAIIFKVNRKRYLDNLMRLARVGARCESGSRRRETLCVRVNRCPAIRGRTTWSSRSTRTMLCC